MGGQNTYGRKRKDKQFTTEDLSDVEDFYRVQDCGALLRGYSECLDRHEAEHLEDCHLEWMQYLHCQSSNLKIKSLKYEMLPKLQRLFAKRVKR